MNKNKDIYKGTTVFVGEKHIDVALRKFKQKVEDSNVLEVIKSKMYYEKPTTERKRKKSAAKARWLKKLKMQELPKKMF